MLGVLAADCAPIVLCDPHNGVIAAIHAGWRGAVSGVIENAVDVMAQLAETPARRSPASACLSKSSFEVGPNLVDAVLDATPWADTLFESLAQGTASISTSSVTASRALPGLASPISTRSPTTRSRRRTCISATGTQLRRASATAGGISRHHASWLGG